MTAAHLINASASWFIAFDAPVQLVAAPPPTKVRLIHPDDFHATLAFFGASGETKALRGWSVLEGLRPPSFSVRVGTLSLFGGRQPRAIAVELSAPEFVRWAEKVRPLLLEACNAPADTRSFCPHVTVARIQHKASGADHERAREWMKCAQAKPERITLDRLGLYTWSNDPHGPRYRRARQLYTNE